VPTEILSHLGFPRLAVAEDATTPDPGIAGVWVWSTSVGRFMYWNGTNWISVPTAAGGATPVVISPASFSTAQTDYNPSGFSTATQVRLTTSAAADINSLATRGDGVELTLTNIGTFAITLKDEFTTGTTAAQRFALNGDVVILPEASVRIIYDGTTARWRAAERPTKTIADLAALTTPALDDELVVWDTDAAETKRLDLQDLTTGIGLKLNALASEPAPQSGGVLLYSRSIAGRHLPKIVGPSGIDTILQVGLHGNSVILISPTSGTAAPSIIGGTLTTAATMSFQYTAGSTNRWSSTQRKRFQTSTTAGNASGMRLAYAHVHRGNAAGFGGFFFRAQLGAQINLAGGQKFVGLTASTGALAGDPSALVNMCGMGYDAGDASTGNWFFMRNDGAGAAVKVDLGSNAARGTTQGWDLVMFMAPNGSELFVRIVNLNTDAIALDTSYTTELPAVNTGMAFKAEVRNGAVAAADNLEIAKVYIETDY
jgi:hypothetical protein